MNKFSIILPVHNGGELVKICVNSIRNQTLQGFNLTVLDNCSTDGTVSWIESLNDERIKIIKSTEFLSIEDNWGRILDCKKNEFVTLIGHDDILLPHYLSEMNALINRHPNATLYQAHYNFIDKDGEVTGPCKPMDEKQFGYEFLAAQMAQTIDSMGTGYMMRSLDYDALGGIPINYPNLIFADHHLWTSLTMLGYKATTLKTCFNYRVHNSVSKVTNGEAYGQAFEQYVYFIASISQTDPQIKLVVERYGLEMLMYYAEALSHRILKTPVAKRKITVDDFLIKCSDFASLLIPNVQFNPMEKKKIKLAKYFDSNNLSRSAFHLIKRMSLAFS